MENFFLLESVKTEETPRLPPIKSVQSEKIIEIIELYRDLPEQLQDVVIERLIKIRSTNVSSSLQKPV